MSNNASYSHSFTVGGSASAPTEDSRTSPLVAFATCELIPIDAQMTLVINRENGKQQLVAAQVVEALKTCTEFATIRDHAQRICALAPTMQGQEQNVETTLEQLRQSEFLLQASTVCERLNQNTERQLPDTRIFVITCDRPTALERLLDSMLHAGGLSKYDALYLIDDSKLDENRAANKDLIERFNTRCPQSMDYFGQSEQTALLNSLVTALPEYESGIRFLIDAASWKGKPSYGRSRTLCLLLSVGYRVVVLDDDILCQAVRPAVPEEGIAVGGEGRREASFFADPEALMAHAVTMEESPLDLHSSYLGCGVGSAVSGLNGGPLLPEQLRGTNAAMANLWNADSPVLVSQCGSWGDPGTGDAHWTLNLSEHSVSRLLSAQGGVTHAIEARCAWLGAPRPTIMKMAFMSQMTGLDNSALLPPYFPVYRGEDLMFAAMVEAMHPHGAILEQAFAVPHLPMKRSRKTLRDPIAGAGSTALFAAYLTNQIDYNDVISPEQRLAMIAQVMARMVERSTADLLLDYRREVAKGHAIQLHSLRSQLARTRDFESGNWQGYLERGIVELEQALQKEWSPEHINGVSDEGGAERLVKDFKVLANGFQQGLLAWPHMRKLTTYP